MFDANSYSMMDKHPTLEPQDETTLVKLAIEGDGDAFGDLYERYLNQIFRYIYYRIGDSRQAEDLTEIVFLKVWESLKSFQVNRISFKGWLFRVAHNLLVDYYRTHKQQQSLDDDLEIADSGFSPEDQMILTERETLVFTALQQLKQEYQNVLTLRFINGHSHTETAATLGRSIGAVRVLQHRALRALHKELEILRRKQGE